MTTAIERHTGDAPKSTVAWAAEADAAYEIAKRIVITSFVPKPFVGKPEEAAAAILAGAEVGLTPLAALRSFDVIQGVAAPRALTLRAIALNVGCDIQTTEETDTRVVMRGRRPGGTDWETVTWTKDRARQMGLLEKDQWVKQPRTMLIARATSELCRRIAADFILGLGYTAEEQDLEEDTPKAAARTVKRRPAAASPVVEDVPLPALEASVSEGRVVPPPPVVEDVPDHPDIDLDVDQDSDLPDPVTDPQRRCLHALFTALDIEGRDMRLAYCSDVTGRDIPTSTDLTKAEASAVIESLTALEAARRNIPPSPPPDDHNQPPLPGEDQ